MKSSEASIPKHFLLEFSSLLRFQGQVCCGTGQQTTNTDRFTGFIAVTIVASIDALNGLLDFLQQLAFTVASAQLQSVLFFNGSAVCRVGYHHGVFAQMLSRFACVCQDTLLEVNQFQSEICHLCIVHVLIVRHGHDFSIGQLIGFFGFPVVGQFGVFFNGNEWRWGQDLGRHVL